MEIIQELLPGVFVLAPSRFEDRRGVLSIPFNAAELKKLTGNVFPITQTMHSVSKKWVLRGLHYQSANYPIAKLISCPKGRIYDVIVDLRSKSLSFGSWVAVELNQHNAYQLYAPVGTAHGYLSLTEGSEVFYYQAGDYNAPASRILAWDDPDLAIRWPVDRGRVILSERDQFNGHSWQEYADSPIF